MFVDDLGVVSQFFEDDLSKEIYSARVKRCLLGGDECLDFLYDYYKDSRILDLEKYDKATEYVVCGAGFYGRKTIKALQHAGYKVKCVLDNDYSLSGRTVEGVEIQSFIEFISEKRNLKSTIVIIDNLRLAHLFFNELVQIGCPQNKIYMTYDNGIRTAFGKIYFDLPELKHEANETFIDAGSFDGETSQSFIGWCGGKYNKIYAFEPMYEGYVLSRKKLKGIKNMELHNTALGSKKGKANFASQYGRLMGSKLGEDGDSVNEVEIETIDEIVTDDKITFIKMDIEGAELDALKGAKKTLQRDMPKLAISLYHKNEDLVEIPLWIKHNVPDYKFYLRHYSNKRWDLVLYCV